MRELEDVRPMDGMQAPLQVRAELRQLFDRWLARLGQHHHTLRTHDVVDDLSLLNLCKHYRVEYPGRVEDIADAWDKSAERITDGAPSFSDLVASDWVFFDGGRWNMQRAPRGTSSAIKYPSTSTKTFLQSLGKPFLVARTESPPADIQALVAKIGAEEWLERGFPCYDARAMAARLWEMLCPKPHASAVDSSDWISPAHELTDADESGLGDADSVAVDRAFMEWSGWCAVLRAGSGWDRHWGDIEKRYCREAAQRALTRQSIWGTWDDDASRYAKVLTNTFEIQEAQLRYVRLPLRRPPPSLVFRADWLGWPEIEHLMMDRLGMSTVDFALGLLCSELEKTDTGPGLQALAQTVISFVADHPMALQHCLFRVERAPALLVDLLMHERTACLAAKLAIKWRTESKRGDDRNLGREAQTKGFAIQDSLSFLAYHLDKCALDAQECAALLNWCYASGFEGKGSGADSRMPFGEQLLRLVVRANSKLQSSILKNLVDQTAYQDNIPRARFTGVLSAMESLIDAPLGTAWAVVDLYSKFARNMNLDWTDASSLSKELAARLVAIALAQTGAVRDALFIPFDSVQLLKEMPEDNNSQLPHSIARTLRTHIRLLARAVAGWPDDAIPQELSESLLALVTKNVIEHREKWRVGALTDRYRPSHIRGREQGSPAKDIAAAWRRLNVDQQDALLTNLVQTDDPVLLAELCQNLPAAAKNRILPRLRYLKPTDASDVWMWPEVQHRIEALLVTGEYVVAREYLESVEAELQRAPQEFRLNLFSLNLQLLMMEKDWSTLDSAAIPPSLNEATTRQATDYLTFYKATSHLLRDDGNLDHARVALERLAANPSAPSAYRQNAFAVAIRQLSGGTPSRLEGINKEKAESLLNQINSAIASSDNVARTNLIANRAQLLLALQRPEEALRSVAPHRKDARSADLELIAVRANSDMGRPNEAMAVLDAAILELGPDDRLIAAKDELQAGTPISNTAATSIVVDPISSIRAALQTLSELSISDVGNVLGPVGGGVRGYLMREVSRAVGSLQNMSAMLRKRTSPENDAKLEDDLNTAVREILRVSLGVAKWSVNDQSLGGSTFAGNPGKRDAVIVVANQEIAIYEALVCSAVNKTEIRAHFHRLVRYGVCDVYFHVIYSYTKKVGPVLDYVRKMLAHEAPDDFTYLECDELTIPNYATSGYVAYYQVDHRDVAVVFFIADLKT